jgi:hypothetical protein
VCLDAGVAVQAHVQRQRKHTVVARWMAIFDSDTDAVDNFYEPNSVMRCVRAECRCITCQVA